MEPQEPDNNRSYLLSSFPTANGWRVSVRNAHGAADGPPVYFRAVVICARSS
ncbi:hypothetical protein HNR42_002177 [Deinobacterium chartae]|uniref:Uncharacterized protein n=1 Tax=Deinobacterium chartae TaxID=521158 RepID=A0A841I413_9DEIO|nr:hypothetical protein [Deinobacterium chartae]